MWRIGHLKVHKCIIFWMSTQFDQNYYLLLLLHNILTFFWQYFWGATFVTHRQCEFRWHSCEEEMVRWIRSIRLICVGEHVPRQFWNELQRALYSVLRGVLRSGRNFWYVFWPMSRVPVWNVWELCSNKRRLCYDSSHVINSKPHPCRQLDH